MAENANISKDRKYLLLSLEEMMRFAETMGGSAEQEGFTDAAVILKQEHRYLRTLHAAISGGAMAELLNHSEGR